ncbi:LysR family transcriptional regulator, partial [Bacillus cereus]|nr:LysR family transcriptional regulator [Bacillus cereus]
PAIVVEKDIREGTIKELHLENTISPIYTQIAWHKDKWMTVPLRQFIDVTREFFVTD